MCTYLGTGFNILSIESAINQISTYIIKNKLEVDEIIFPNDTLSIITGSYPFYNINLYNQVKHHFCVVDNL
jgi:hypothetical protein